MDVRSFTFSTPDPLASVRPFTGAPAPNAPPFPPPTNDLLNLIRQGYPCSYCPADRKRPAYRAVAASEGLPDGSQRVVARFVCAACDIVVLDEVLGAPGAPALRERVRELEEMVEGLRQDVAARGRSA